MTRTERIHRTIVALDNLDHPSGCPECGSPDIWASGGADVHYYEDRFGFDPDCREIFCGDCEESFRDCLSFPHDDTVRVALASDHVDQWEAYARRVAWRREYSPGPLDVPCWDHQDVWGRRGCPGWLLVNGSEIQRCDDCDRFKDDDTAARAAWAAWTAFSAGIYGDNAFQAAQAVIEALDPEIGLEHRLAIALASARDAARPRCGHSACRQNWIETGEVECVSGEPLHVCPDNPHLGCGDCGGDPVCDCAPGECPEDL